VGAQIWLKNALSLTVKEIQYLGVEHMMVWSCDFYQTFAPGLVVSVPNFKNIDLLAFEISCCSLNVDKNNNNNKNNQKMNK